MITKSSGGDSASFGLPHTTRTDPAHIHVVGLREVYHCSRCQIAGRRPYWDKRAARDARLKLTWIEQSLCGLSRRVSLCMAWRGDRKDKISNEAMQALPNVAILPPVPEQCQQLLSCHRSLIKSPLSSVECRVSGRRSYQKFPIIWI